MGIWKRGYLAVAAGLLMVSLSGCSREGAQQPAGQLQGERLLPREALAIRG